MSLDSREQLIKKYIDNKSDLFIDHTENVIFGYGKAAVAKYLDCVLFAINQYSSLSSDDVVDILDLVYRMIYPRD